MSTSYCATNGGIANTERSRSILPTMITLATTATAAISLILILTIHVTTRWVIEDRSHSGGGDAISRGINLYVCHTCDRGRNHSHLASGFNVSDRRSISAVMVVVGVAVLPKGISAKCSVEITSKSRPVTGTPWRSHCLSESLSKQLIRLL